MEYITLNDGNRIPQVGVGVFMISNDGPTYDAVLAALKAGYRHIEIHESLLIQSHDMCLCREQA